MTTKHRPATKKKGTTHQALFREVLAIHALEQKILDSRKERADRELLARASRGTYDRAALKSLIPAMREMCMALETLVRGAET